MDEEIFNLGLPILGICYGMQLTAKYFKGEILSSPKREYGKMNILIEDKSLLFKDLYDEEEVWMSHGDHVAKIPQGFKLLAKSQNGLVASIANEEKKIYCVQFHPRFLLSAEILCVGCQQPRGVFHVLGVDDLDGGVHVAQRNSHKPRRHTPARHLYYARVGSRRAALGA